MRNAILIFIREERAESKYKNLQKLGVHTARALFKSLNRHIISLAEETGVDTFVIQGKNQVGNNFGERIAHAFESIYSMGYEKVVAVGNDALALTKDHFLDAFKALVTNGIVIGPDQRGGAYLLGFDKNLFDAQSFLAYDWQNPQLQDSIALWAHSNNFDIHTLEALADFIDLDGFLNQIKCSPHKFLQLKLIAILVIGSPSTFLFTIVIGSLYVDFSNPRRGPPQMSI